tara:strand:+ start:1310 stop:3592 length:2283 start_codon:yes stop_codon:yes gene_type:complete
MATQREKALNNKQLWDRANNAHRSRWASLSQKSYDFYLNEQLTKEEEDTLNQSGMPTFTINRVTPIVETMKYFVTANNPRWKAVGVEGSDTDVAQVHSDIADYSWYNSNGKSLYGQVVLDSLTKGIGYFFVDVDKDADRGKGEVVFKRIDPYDVFVDPMSRDLLFRDANFIMVRKNLARTQLMNLFPQFKSKIKNASGESETTSFSQRDTVTSQSILAEDITMGLTIEGEDDDIVSFYECYQKVKVAYVNVFVRIPPTEEELEEIRRVVSIQLEEFQKETEVQLIEKQQQIQQALQAGEIIPERGQLELERAQQMAEQAIEEKRAELMSMAQDKAAKIEQKVLTKKEYNILIKNESVAANIIEAIDFYESRIKVVCSVGDETFLYEYLLAQKEYPIVPIPYTYTGTPYPMSAVAPLIGKQQEINKAHQIMLHNANLASNLRWLYEEGSVPEGEWEQYASAPGALLKYRQGFQPPTPVLPASINNAFYSVTQEGKQDIEYIAGIHSSMMGIARAQPETYRGLLANDEYGTRRIKAWMGNTVEPALEHIGRVFKEVAQATYQIDKIFRIVQPEAGQSPDEQEKEVRINIPIYNDYGQAVGKSMDYASAKFDVRIVAGATMPVNRWALLEEYFRWFQSGLIDDVAMVAETDIRNKKQLLQRKSLYSQLQSQLQSMEEGMKDKDGTIETLERQLVQAGIKNKIQTGSLESQKSVLDTQAQQKLLRHIMKGEFNAARKQLEMDMRQVAKDVKDTEEGNMPNVKEK